MATIQAISAREIKDSRGNPTIEIELTTSAAVGIASVPSGASVGVHEALELRDDDGKGVSKAIAGIRESITPAVAGKEFDQQSLDDFLNDLDGTSNKSRLGANAILAVSIAFARAQAAKNGQELYAYLGALAGQRTFAVPQPLFNILNGGKHTQQGVDIQECMLAPIGFDTVRERVEVAKKCMAELETLLNEKGYSTRMGDEGGFAPALSTNDEALELLEKAIRNAGYNTGQVKIALDIAASSFYKNGHYTLRAGGKEQPVTSEEMLAWYQAAVEKYPIVSLEDGFAEDDWGGFVALTKSLGERVSIVGDDLTVTSMDRIHMAVEKGAANACIIKPNQVGTVTEAVAAVEAARSAGWKTFASHRSGETTDTFIADFAVGLSCDYLKAGAPTKQERLVKYNRLIEIEAQLHTV